MHQLHKPETADCTIIIPSHRPPLPRLTLRLHTACLSAKSAFFRGLFIGVSPLDPIQDLSASRLRPLRIPQSRLPRLLPSPPSHPVVFLPVPDPSSIQPLFHWMYFGNTDHIENALDQGDVRWEGLARNVEYLGLSTDIKVFLGCWYRNWLLPSQRSPDCVPCPADEDDPDSDQYYSPPTGDEIQSDDERDRGHTRDVKQLCDHLRLCTTD